MNEMGPSKKKKTGSRSIDRRPAGNHCPAEGTCFAFPCSSNKGIRTFQGCMR